MDPEWVDVDVFPIENWGYSSSAFFSLLETGVVKIACFFLKNVSGTGGNKNCPWFGGELFVATHRKMQLWTKKSSARDCLNPCVWWMDYQQVLSGGAVTRSLSYFWTDVHGYSWDFRKLTRFIRIFLCLAYGTFFFWGKMTLRKIGGWRRGFVTCVGTAP